MMREATDDQDVALWPNLTGAEILTLLAHLGPGTDQQYQRELVDCFQLQLDRRARTYSTGNRQKVAWWRRSRPAPHCSCSTNPPAAWTR